MKLKQQQLLFNLKDVGKENGSKIAINTLSCFDEFYRIETILCRYEKWENNHITQTEVEDFRLRLYEPLEIEQLLNQAN